MSEEELRARLERAEAALRKVDVLFTYLKEKGPVRWPVPAGPSLADDAREAVRAVLDAERP